MYFEKDVTSWISVVDDRHAMLGRLKILERLLMDCVCDMPLEGSKFAGGYDGSEMLFFLDDSLSQLIQEYEGQVARYENVRESSKSFTNSTSRSHGLAAANKAA